jgi:PIN domain-containing protein
VIYADTSFLFSFYALDPNSPIAAQTYTHDARRPLLFTPWQRFELRNSVRLASHRLRRAGRTVPFQVGNVFKRIDDDVADGRLKYETPDWRQAFRLAEELSEQHTATLGAASVDLWHVASAILLRADTFWTFDEDQHALAKAADKFRTIPKLRA